MVKICCNVCNKSTKSKNPKVSYIFKNTLGLYIVEISVLMNNYLKKKNLLKY